DAQDRQTAAQDQSRGELARTEGGDDDLLGDAADHRGGGDLQQSEGDRPEHGQDEPQAHLPAALEQALQPRDQDGGARLRVVGRGRQGGRAAVGGCGLGGLGGAVASVGECHVRTKWTTTATAKVIVDSIARENSMRIPMPRALMATQAEVMPFCQSCWRTTSEMYRPITKPIGRPRKGMTKIPTTPEARPTRTGHIGTSAACR